MADRKSNIRNPESSHTPTPHTPTQNCQNDPYRFLVRRQNSASAEPFTFNPQNQPRIDGMSNSSEPSEWSTLHSDGSEELDVQEAHAWGGVMRWTDPCICCSTGSSVWGCGRMGVWEGFEDSRWLIENPTSAIPNPPTLPHPIRPHRIAKTIRIGFWFDGRTPLRQNRSPSILKTNPASMACPTLRNRPNGVRSMT